MINILLFTLLVSSPEIYGGNALYPDQESLTTSGGSFSGDLHVQDDVKMSYGNTLTSPDAWCLWDSANSQWECEDATGGVFMSVDAGTAVVDFDGGINLVGTTISDDTDGSVTVASGDTFDLNGVLFMDENNLWCAAPTSDVAPDVLMVSGGNAFSAASGGNQTGAPLYIRGGFGSYLITIDNYANCAGDNVGVIINGVTNTLTEGVQWTAATDNATTAISLAAAVDALSVAAAPSASTVRIVVGNTIEMNLTESDATCTTLTEGDTGDIRVAGRGNARTAFDLMGNLLTVDKEQSGYYAGIDGCAGVGTLLCLNYGTTSGQISVKIEGDGDQDARGTFYDSTGAKDMGAACTPINGIAGDFCFQALPEFFEGVAVYNSNITADTTTTGADANSPFINLSGNRFSTPNNYQCDAKIYVDVNSGNPKLVMQVDDSCVAGAGTLTTILSAFDDSVSVSGDITARTLSLNSDNISPAIMITAENTTGEVFIMDRYNDGSGSVNYLARKARGTAAAPAVVQVDDNLFAIRSEAYDGSTFDLTGYMRFEVASVAAGNIGGRWTMYTANSSGSTQLAMMIDQEQKTTLYNDLAVDNTGASVNGRKLYSRGDNAGNQVQSYFYTAYGAQPYMIIGVSDDGTTPADTDVLHIDDNSIRPASDLLLDVGSTSNRVNNTYTKTIVISGVEGAAPAEPYACSNTTVGAIVYVDDTDDGVPSYYCVCLDMDDGSTFDWRLQYDPINTACTAF